MKIQFLKEILICLFMITKVSAQTIRFGAEWTFTNKSLIIAGKQGGNYSVVTSENANARDKLAKEILKKCKDCELIALKNKYFSNEPIYRIVFKKSVWIDIDIDPWVIEINTNAIAADFMQYKDIYQSIFDAAKRIGLEPHQRIGGGHIHIDFKTAFGENELLARNFIVDTINNPEMAMGILGKDYLNAAPLALLSKDQQDMFNEKLTLYDGKVINFDQFIDFINKEVYHTSFDKFNPQPSSKYQAINLSRSYSSSNPRTIELRFFRPPKSFNDFLLQTFINKFVG